MLRTPSLLGRPLRAGRFVALGAVLLSLGGWAGAQNKSVVAAPMAVAPQKGVSWAALTVAQQSTLAPLKADWNSIEPAGKSKWLEVAAKFPNMPQAERDRVHTRMTEWARLTPAQRGQTRLQFQEARAINSAERQARWAEYQALAPDQRLALQSKSQVAAPKVTAVAPTRTGQPPSNPTQPAAKPTNRPTLTAATKAVSPTLVQANPGVTTTLISRPATPSRVDKPGQSGSVIALPANIDRSTLLPRMPATGAVPSAAASSAASLRQ